MHTCHKSIESDFNYQSHAKLRYMFKFADEHRYSNIQKKVTNGRTDERTNERTDKLSDDVTT